MKILSVCMLLFCAGLCLGAQCLAEDIAFSFDDREWEVGYTAENNEQGIREFVLKGESVEKWSELVTVQAFFGLQAKTTPEAYMNSVIERLKEIDPGLIWNIIGKSDKDVIFEWEVKNCPGQDDQYEVSRIISGNAAIWYLHYATKKLPVAPDKRGEWINLLNSSSLRE